MANELPPPLSRRARPVGELALDALLTRAEELAQRWAAALILARPPTGIGGVPLEAIAREGPLLCAQALRALQSDAELDRLTGGGAPSGREQSAPARRIVAITGAGDAVGAVAAVETLRGVLWEALLEEVRLPVGERSSSPQLAELCDRLALVCASALATGIAAQDSPAPPVAEAQTSPIIAAAAARPESVEGGAPPSSAAIIIDEGAEHVSSAQVEDRAPRPVQAAGSPAAVAAERALSWEGPSLVASAGGRSEIEIRDERGAEGPAAWIDSIGSQLARYREDGVSFAALLVEPVEMERLRRAEPAAELQRLTTELERALEHAWSGSLTRQRAGRYWLLAPATDRRGALELAERLRQHALAVRYRGEPLALAIGAAVCPEDGLEASALAAHADVGLYAARSAARRGEQARSTVDGPAGP